MEKLSKLYLTVGIELLNPQADHTKSLGQGSKKDGRLHQPDPRTVTGTKMYWVDRGTTALEVDRRMGLAEWAEESVRGAVNQGGTGGGQGC
ncbi:Hypothetical predicted protein [Paramuricea clavata]|uniref:Uncharacterized protein n=1 Tax=Paramuricea clavata TaxID=317549 RepID=A0A7D9DGK5_PARCT|nr:Hypothetical predicted protein [Paramuricea clavata]